MCDATPIAYYCKSEENYKILSLPDLDNETNDSINLCVVKL